MGVVRRNSDQRTNATVDMEPEILLRGEIGESFQIIDGPSVHRPSVADHAGRLKAGRSVPLNCSAQRTEVDAKIAPGWNSFKRAISEPHRFDRFAVTTVDLVRGIEAEWFLDGCYPVLTHVDTRLDIARDDQGDGVGHGPAADQRAARRSRKADHLLAPVNDLLVQSCGGVIAAAKVGPLDSG